MKERPPFKMPSREEQRAHARRNYRLSHDIEDDIAKVLNVIRHCDADYLDGKPIEWAVNLAGAGPALDRLARFACDDPDAWQAKP
jgi:hypothetical protein